MAPKTLFFVKDDLDHIMRPGQGGHLVLTQQGASNKVTRRTDVSTLLHVDLRGESIATLLPQGASLTVLEGQQEMSIKIKDETCVIGFVTTGENPFN